MTEKKKIVQEYIEENKPNNPEEHVRAFAYLKATQKITQKMYAEANGFSDRYLRKMMEDTEPLFDEELAIHEATDEPKLDISAITSKRTITESQLDKFVEVLYESAIKGNARDRQLLIEFTGMTKEDVLTLNKVKSQSLRYWIMGELPNISTYMDTRTLGLMTETSEHIYRGDKESAKNAQTFVNSSIEDESFKLELMYWGAVHLSMINNTEHPDLELLATAVRLDKIIKDVPETFKKHRVKGYAQGKNMAEKKAPKSDTEIEKMLAEVIGAEEASDVMMKKKLAGEVVKAPDVDKLQIENRASQYEDELRVLLTTEEEMRHIMSKSFNN